MLLGWDQVGGPLGPASRTGVSFAQGHIGWVCSLQACSNLFVSPTLLTPSALLTFLPLAPVPLPGPPRGSDSLLSPFPSLFQMSLPHRSTVLPAPQVGYREPFPSHFFTSSSLYFVLPASTCLFLLSLAIWMRLAQLTGTDFVYKTEGTRGTMLLCHSKYTIPEFSEWFP